jgi:septal ring factor EnvC (AmiA/AmiB activator)
MKDLKKEVQAATKELKALTRKTEAMAKKVAKLEKAQAAAERKPKAKAEVKVAKKAPAKKKGVAKLTATDQVVNIIKRSKKGADVPTLMKKTGLADKTLRNILFRAGKLGKIKRAGRGVYVGARS